jgi:histidine ammonia-lyase
MLAQYTAASLVAESRILSHPASIDSIPTSGSQEDHVSMGWGAARKLWEALTNIRQVLAIEIMCAVQALEYRKPLMPASAIQAVVARVREEVAPLEEDRVIAGDIEAIAWMVATGELVEVAGLEGGFV